MRLSDLCRLVSKVSYRASMRPLTAPNGLGLRVWPWLFMGWTRSARGLVMRRRRSTTAAALITMLFGHSTGHMDFGESFVNLLLNETEQAQNKHPN